MAKRAVDRELWDALVAAFLVHPANYAAAAKGAGCDARTAKRAWEQGWPRKGLGPVCEEVERRLEEAREQRRAFERERAIREQEARDAERKNMLKRVTQEEKLADNVRVNTLGLHEAVGNMLLVAVPMARELVAAQKSGALSSLSVKEKARVIKDAAIIMRLAGDVSERAIRVERLRTGVGAPSMEERPSMDLRAAAEYLTTMNKTIERARAIELRSRTADDGSEYFEADSAGKYDA